MADTDETRIIAWLDGELAPAEADAVAAEVAADADLTALAERHRRLRARFAAAFDPLAAAPSADVISLADARAARERAARSAKPTPSRRWWIPTAIAASLTLAVGLVEFRPCAGSRDALAPEIAQALDRQLSGDTGPIRIALTFRDRTGTYCRSFTGDTQSGIACRGSNGWQLRQATPTQGKTTDYRMASGERDTMAAVEKMIAGDPLDRAAEENARAEGWR